MIAETWVPTTFTESEYNLIAERVRELGSRLEKSIKVLQMSQIAAQQSGYGKWGLSYPLNSLAQGPLGLALMYHEFERIWPAEGWGALAHKYLAQPLRKFLVREDQPVGLLVGTSGLFFVLRQLAQNGTQEAEFYAELKTVISVLVSNYTSNLVLDAYPHPEKYDLVTGTVGIGAALLTRDRDAEAPETEALRQLIAHLLWLGRQDTAHYMDQFGKWYASPLLAERQVRWQAQDQAYRGYGMRNGLAGLVALLSLVVLDDLGMYMHDTEETLAALCKQMKAGMRRDKQGLHWPQEAASDHYHTQGTCAPFAWCNGTAGITRALWLAGQALHDSTLCTLALECLSAMSKRWRKELPFIGPSLCHGLAGMIQVYAHFVHDTGSSMFSDDLHALTSRLLDLFEPDRPFGYRARGPEYIRFDSPWLFEGAAGVALALLTVISPEAPAWDRVMLLA
jgi:lantibiotic biosynthesis protein